MENFSNAMGIINLFRGVGCFLGPFLGGIISEQFSVVAAFFYSSIMFSIGLVFALIVSFGTKFGFLKNANYKAANTNEI